MVQIEPDLRRRQEPTSTEMRGTLLPLSSFDLDLGMSLPSYSDSAKVAYVLQGMRQ